MSAWEKKIEERPEEERPESESETRSEDLLSPEEQERVLDEYARPQLEGLRSILAEKQEQFAARS